MKLLRVITVLAAAILLPIEGRAADPSCPAPEEMLAPSAPLPGLAKRLKEGRETKMVFYGTASTTGAGIGKPDSAFPERFAEAFRRKFPAARITLIVRSRQGETAAQMVERMADEVLKEKPDMVFWQTGSVDAIRGVDINDFGDNLWSGLDLLRKAGSEVLLIDQQYNPHIAPASNVEGYQDYMEGIARAHGINLFSRFELMRHWSEIGRFPFNEVTKTDRMRIASEVHDCIGRLLAEMVAKAVNAETAPR